MGVGGSSSYSSSLCCYGEPELPGLPVVGVSIKLLRAIQDVVLKRDQYKEWRTIDVVHLVWKWTRGTKLSLAEHLRRRHIFLPHKELKVVYDDVVGQDDQPAQYYLCHAWNNNFHELVDAVERWIERNTDDKNFYLDKATTMFWIDFCVVNQWSKLPPDYDAYRQLIGHTIKKTVVVMSPWGQPLVCTRSWCLWEMYCTLSSSNKAKLSVALSQREVALMKSACRSHPDAEMQLDATIKVQIGKASRKRDKVGLELAFLRAQKECCDRRAAEERKEEEGEGNFTAFLSAEKQKRTPQKPGTAAVAGSAGKVVAAGASSANKTIPPGTKNLGSKHKPTSGSGTSTTATPSSGTKKPTVEKNALGWGKDFGATKIDPKDALLYQEGFDGINERLNEFIRRNVPRDYEVYSRQTIGRYEISWASKKVT